MGVGRRAATLAVVVLLTGCAHPGLDADQAAQERRTCASLRERVAARTLDRFGLALGEQALGEQALDEKTEALDPRVLAADPDRWYATLAQELADAPFGAVRHPTSRSPASRVVDTCRDLGS